MSFTSNKTATYFLKCLSLAVVTLMGVFVISTKISKSKIKKPYTQSMKFNQ